MKKATKEEIKAIHKILKGKILFVEFHFGQGTVKMTFDSFKEYLKIENEKK